MAYDRDIQFANSMRLSKLVEEAIIDDNPHGFLIELSDFLLIYSQASSELVHRNKPALTDGCYEHKVNYLGSLFRTLTCGPHRYEPISV